MNREQSPALFSERTIFFAPLQLENGGRPPGRRWEPVSLGSPSVPSTANLTGEPSQKPPPPTRRGLRNRLGQKHFHLGLTGTAGLHSVRVTVAYRSHPLLWACLATDFSVPW